MRKLLIMAMFVAAGCQNVIGPFAARSPTRVDEPCLSIEEQERRGRDRLALPDESPEVGPYAGTSRSTQPRPFTR